MTYDIVNHILLSSKLQNVFVWEMIITSIFPRLCNVWNVLCYGLVGRDEFIRKNATL